ncbi:MAG: uL13 family ribosomal protein [Patescibacteria group bacterium]
MRYVIDAKGKKLGRVASEAASRLRGKTLASFSRTMLPDITVEILNASGLLISAKKARGTTYRRYSGYPGGLKETTLSEFDRKKGRPELLRKVVLGMLPKNKLRARLIKRLVVKS